MKYIGRALVASLVTAGAALAMAAPAQAGLLVKSAKDCAAEPEPAKVFKPWLDYANYIAAPGGDAESAAGWKLDGGAAVVAGNAPWKVGDKSDSHSLLLPRGSSATTD